jgi:hypothetical protein
MELADSHFLFLWVIATLATNQKFLKKPKKKKKVINERADG